MANQLTVFVHCISWILLIFALLSCGLAEKQANGTKTFKTSERYNAFQFKWDEVGVPLTVSAWILIASIASIGFHLSKKIGEIFPECSLLIVLGLGIGAVLAVTHIMEVDSFRLSANIFFLYLLPPIIFEAGYSMPNRAFFDNIGSILIFAVLGTLWNTVAIGVSLWLLGLTGLFGPVLPLLHFLLFAALISAVDPVAVLVVFEEIHVNDVLFITVFGESLLNDAVTVVLYRIFLSFAEIGAENLIPIDYAVGAVSFFTVSFGGIAIGVIWALAISFLTKFTKHAKVVTPVFVFIMPYCAYLLAEMLGVSAILAIVFCAIVMKPYVKLNVSPRAVVSIKYFCKMLANASETIIFMFLGLSTVALGTIGHLNIAFAVSTLLFCLIYRPIGVMLQCYFVNKSRMHPFTKIDQFVMSYGGLRGAIAYGLAISIPDEIGSEKNMFVNTCIIVIIFTVFVQGLTMKPLINYLQVKKDEQRTKTMLEHIFNRFNDCTLAGIEHICGLRGEHWLRNHFDIINERYLKPILVHRKKEVHLEQSKIFREFARITVNEAVNVIEEKINASAVDGTLGTPININEITERIYRKLSNASAIRETADGDEQRNGALEHLDINMLFKKFSSQSSRNVYQKNSRPALASRQTSTTSNAPASPITSAPPFTFILTTENGETTETLPEFPHTGSHHQFTVDSLDSFIHVPLPSPTSDRSVISWRQAKNNLDPEFDESDASDWLTPAMKKLSTISTKSHKNRVDPERDGNNGVAVVWPASKPKTSTGWSKSHSRSSSR